MPICWSQLGDKTYSSVQTVGLAQVFSEAIFSYPRKSLLWSSVAEITRTERWREQGLGDTNGNLNSVFQSSGAWKPSSHPLHFCQGS